MEYSNIRWKKCDYKFAIKCFKLMAANKSLECEIDALGKVKASTDWRTGMDLFIMHKDVVPTFEKRGIFECEHFEKEFRTFLRIKLTPLGQLTWACSKFLKKVFLNIKFDGTVSLLQRI